MTNFALWKGPFLKQEQVELQIDDSSLEWTYKRSSVLHRASLKMRQILTSVVTQGSDGSLLDVYYASYVKGCRKNVIIKKDVVTFIGCHSLCSYFQKQILNILAVQEFQRPKNLIMLVNPTSGWMTSRELYHEIVLPLLQLCNITATFYELKDVNDTAGFIQQQNFSTVDGVIIMGGDGSVNHVTSELLKKVMDLEQKDINNPSTKMTKVRPRIGIIPTGTYNAVNYNFNSCTDIESCTINIILGNSVSSDISAVYCGGKYVRLSNLDVVFGYAVYINYKMEYLRFLKVFRNIAMMPLFWWCWRMFDAEIEFIPVIDGNRIFPIEACDTSDVDKTSDNSEWRTWCGTFGLIWGLNYNCHNHFKHINDGWYITPLPSTGKMVLSVCKKQSFFSAASLLNSLRVNGRENTKSPLMLTVEVKEFKVHAHSSWSEQGHRELPIGQDGETIFVSGDLCFHVKLHPDVFQVFCADNEMVKDVLHFAE